MAYLRIESKKKASSRFEIPFDRQELADYSNMTTSNAIRTISALVSEKVISVKDKRIKLLEDEMLLRISLMG